MGPNPSVERHEDVLEMQAHQTILPGPTGVSKQFAPGLLNKEPDSDYDRVCGSRIVTDQK